MARSSDLMEEIVDQFLACRICCESYKTPKTLTCMHTFCEICLEKHAAAEQERSYTRIYTRNVSCPICRKKTELPSGGVRRLPDNFLLSNLTEIIERRQDKTKQAICEICKPTGKYIHEAISKCLDCNKMLCRTCVNLHKNTKVTQGHGLFDVQVEKEVECKIHQEEPVRFYCERCQVCICVLCTFQEHKGHEVTSFTEGMAKHKNCLDELLQSCKTRVNDVKDQLELIHECEGRIKQAEDLIRDTAIETISMIRKKEKQMTQDLRQYFGSEVHDFIQKKQHLQHMLETLKNTCNLTDMILKDDSIELLLLKKDIHKKLQGLTEKKLDLPPTRAKKEVEFIPGSVEFGNLKFGKPAPQKRTISDLMNGNEYSTEKVDQATMTIKIPVQEKQTSTEPSLMVKRKVQTESNHFTIELNDTPEPSELSVELYSTDASVASYGGRDDEDVSPQSEKNDVTDDVTSRKRTVDRGCDVLVEEWLHKAVNESHANTSTDELEVSSANSDTSSEDSQQSLYKKPLEDDVISYVSLRDRVDELRKCEKCGECGQKIRRFPITDSGTSMYSIVKSLEIGTNTDRKHFYNRATGTDIRRTKDAFTEAFTISADVGTITSPKEVKDSFTSPLRVGVRDKDTMTVTTGDSNDHSQQENLSNVQNSKKIMTRDVGVSTVCVNTNPMDKCCATDRIAQRHVALTVRPVMKDAGVLKRPHTITRAVATLPTKQITTGTQAHQHSEVSKPKGILVERETNTDNVVTVSTGVCTENTMPVEVHERGTSPDPLNISDKSVTATPDLVERMVGSDRIIRDLVDSFMNTNTVSTKECGISPIPRRVATIGINTKVKSRSCGVGTVKTNTADRASETDSPKLVDHASSPIVLPVEDKECMTAVETVNVGISVKPCISSKAIATKQVVLLEEGTCTPTVVHVDQSTSTQRMQLLNKNVGTDNTSTADKQTSTVDVTAVYKEALASMSSRVTKVSRAEGTPHKEYKTRHTSPTRALTASRHTSPIRNTIKSTGTETEYVPTLAKASSPVNFEIPVKTKDREVSPIRGVMETRSTETDRIVTATKASSPVPFETKVEQKHRHTSPIRRSVQTKGTETEKTSTELKATSPIHFYVHDRHTSPVRTAVQSMATETDTLKTSARGSSPVYFENLFTTCSTQTSEGKDQTRDTATETVHISTCDKASSPPPPGTTSIDTFPVRTSVEFPQAMTVSKSSSPIHVKESGVSSNSNMGASEKYNNLASRHEPPNLFETVTSPLKNLVQRSWTGNNHYSEAGPLSPNSIDEICHREDACDQLTQPSAGQVDRHAKIENRKTIGAPDLRNKQTQGLTECHDSSTVSNSLLVAADAQPSGLRDVCLLEPCWHPLDVLTDKTNSRFTTNVPGSRPVIQTVERGMNTSQVITKCKGTITPPPDMSDKAVTTDLTTRVDDQITHCISKLRSVSERLNSPNSSPKLPVALRPPPSSGSSTSASSKSLSPVSTPTSPSLRPLILVRRQSEGDIRKPKGEEAAVRPDSTLAKEMLEKKKRLELAQLLRRNSLPEREEPTQEQMKPRLQAVRAPKLGSAEELSSFASAESKPGATRRGRPPLPDKVRSNSRSNQGGRRVHSKPPRPPTRQPSRGGPGDTQSLRHAPPNQQSSRDSSGEKNSCVSF